MFTIFERQILMILICVQKKMNDLKGNTQYYVSLKSTSGFPSKGGKP